MTALAKNDDRLVTSPRGRGSYIVTNAATVYVNGGVGLTSAGRLSPWADTAGMLWKGLCMGGSTRNSSANAGGKVTGDTLASPPYEADVDESGSLLRAVPVAGASAQTDLDRLVYSASDNLRTDLTLTATTNVKPIGVIVRYNSATSFDVRLFTPAEYQAFPLVSDITALTDSSGGGATDNTIGAVTAPTAIAATLTDSTGASGTHDDTLADGLNSSAPSAVGTSALGDLVATNGGWGASTEAGFDSISTKFDLAVTDIANLRATVLTLQSDAVIQNQNDSDLAQKVIELVTAQGQNRTAIVALTDAVAELAAKVNEVIADLNTN